jgi:hypothetical protein
MEIAPALGCDNRLKTTHYTIERAIIQPIFHTQGKRHGLLTLDGLR